MKKREEKKRKERKRKGRQENTNIDCYAEFNKCQVYLLKWESKAQFFRAVQQV